MSRFRLTRPNRISLAGSLGVGGNISAHAPPFIAANPVSVNVTAPDGATFTVVATGTAPLSYQWQRNGVNISGATLSSYTLSPTTTGDTGAQFRCVVTNPYGSATSNAVLLTVASGTTELPALGALSFYANSGADDYARLLSIPPTFGTGEFTFEFRCKLDESYPVGAAGGTSTTNWSNADPARYSNSSWWYAGNFMLDGHNNTDVRLGTFSVQVIGGGRLRWTFGDNTQLLSNGGLLAVQPVPASSAASLLDDSWHHVALVRRWSGASSATLEMWIDGVLIASETSTARTNMQTYWATWGGYGGGIQNGWLLGAEKFSAGGGAYWDDYKGQVGYLRFYNRAKTSTELANDWARDSTQGESGLVGLFQVGSLAANRTYDTIRPTEYIECFPQAGAARVTDIPIVARLPSISFTRGTQGSVNLATGARTGTVSPAAGAYVAGFNPTSHVIQRDPASTALPAGVSLSTAGVMAYDGTGAADVTANNVRIQVLASADADWLARSTAAGVTMANRFDALVTAPVYPAVPGYYRSSGGSTPLRAVRDTSVRCSGTGSLRLDALDGFEDVTGYYILPLGANFGQNSTIYVQLRYRLTSSTLTGSGHGRKVCILHYNFGSCSDGLEITVQNTNYSGYFQAYTRCGGSGNLPRVTNVPLVANQWYTIYQQIDIGTYGAGNSRLRMWAAPVGQSLTLWLDRTMNLDGGSNPADPYFNRMTLTGYETNGLATPPGGSVWYDEVIVSTQPIAAPTALPIGG